MEYITVKEYAELKGCSVRYTRMQINNGKLESVMRENTENKCMQYLIPVTELPEELKRKYYERRRKETGLPPEPAEKQPLKTVKMPVRKNLDEFTAEEREQISMWCGIIKEWLDVRAKFRKKTEADPMFCGKMKLEHQGINISPDILYRKYTAYINHDLEGLVDHRGGWNKGQCSIRPEVFDIFTAFYLNRHQPSVENCYNKTVAVCREYYPELASSIPSSRTFRRAAEKIPKCIVAYARKGEKEFTDKYLEHVERNMDSLKCNDIWIADNHTLDFFSVSDSGEVHRASITAYMDAKSGIITAAELCDHPNSDTTLYALRSACLQGYGLPLGVYFDNGSEFLAGDVAGRGHRKKASWQKEEHPVQILSLLGITMTNAIPANAKAKPIERFFYTFKEHYSKSIESYCGGKPSERPEECSQLVKEKRLITDKELRDILPVFIRGYNSELYGGKEKLYKGKKRIEVWNEAVRSGDVEFRTSDKDNLRLLMRRSTKIQQIKRNGVFIEWAGRKIWYKDENTVFHIGEEVFVRFDPADLSEVMVYEKDTDKFLYRYACADHLDLPFIGAEQEDIQTFMRSQAATRKAVRKQLDEYKKYDAVSLLEAELLRAKQNAEGYEIAQPEVFTPVIAPEHEGGEMNITRVEFADIVRANEAVEKSKGA
ncbi:MAG: Mu transposase C-terminal domain-containing protein [Oscillospiraceae bacterium]|nr:Mu transposase C-terminal domain-containing protein [Oscillospiraceae bacterium]